MNYSGSDPGLIRDVTEPPNYILYLLLVPDPIRCMQSRFGLGAVSPFVSQGVDELELDLLLQGLVRRGHVSVPLSTNLREHIV